MITVLARFHPAINHAMELWCATAQTIAFMYWRW